MNHHGAMLVFSGMGMCPVLGVRVLSALEAVVGGLGGLRPSWPLCGSQCPGYLVRRILVGPCWSGIA